MRRAFDTSPEPFAWLTKWAQERRDGGLRRTLTPRKADAALIDLASNDYLGLARDPRVVEAAVVATRLWGAGSTGSRLVTGTTQVHTDFEEALADFVGTDAALAFSSGYLANLGAIAALSGPDSILVSDATNHASIIDACRLSRATVTVVPHLDHKAVVDALDARLQNNTHERALVVSDAVFSVDGDRAPIDDLIYAVDQNGASILVDEAHSLGVVGPGGRGILAEGSYQDRDYVVMTATLSKAFGSQGGVVLGSRAVIDHLVDAARPFIFDTALAPSSVAAAHAALAVIKDDPGLPARALARAQDLALIARAVGLSPSDPAAAVVSIPLGSPEEALAAQALCHDHGVNVACFRPPSVPDGVSRLRLTARADLTDDDLTTVGAALAAVAAFVESKDAS